MAQSSTRDLLRGFDADQECFYLVSADGRLRVWDVASGRLRNTYADEEAHLADQCTAMAVGKRTSKKSKKSKKESAVASSLGHVAIGTKSGAVIVWDLVAGEIIQRLGDSSNGHDQKVTGAVFSADGTTLYTCSDDKHIIEWNVSTGEQISKFKASKHAVTAIALNHAGDRLATGSSTISIWDVAARAILLRFNGHGAAIRSLAFTSDDAFLVSTAAEDRFVNVWSTEEQTDNNAVKVFALDGAVVGVDARLGDNGKFAVSGLSEQGLVHVWRGVDFTSKKKRALEASSADAVFRPAAPAAAPLAVIFAADKEALLMSRGAIIKPTFQTLPYVDDSNTPISNTTLPVLDGNLLTKDGKSAGGIPSSVQVHDAHVAVAGPSDMVMAAPKLGRAAQRSKTAEAEDSLSDEEKGRAGGPKSIAPGSAAVLTLGDRVEAMAAESTATAAKKVPKADSLQAALVQALASQDKQMLEYCLNVMDHGVITRTVQRLPTSAVLPLLNALIERFRAKPARGAALLKWIRAVLLYHTSYLMTVPNLTATLSPLYQAVDARLGVYKKLTKLGGRLDLVLAQVGKDARGDTEAEASQRPKNVYTEGESEEEEDEDGEGEDSDEDDDDEDDDDDNDDMEGMEGEHAGLDEEMEDASGSGDESDGGAEDFDDE